MKMQVCIRGCGKAGERCFWMLQYKEKADICFSDMDSSKKMYCGKTVYSVSKSIERYHEGLIRFFIVSLEYSEKIREDMIKELLSGNVKEEHILFFPGTTETTYKIDGLADLKFIKKYCPWRLDFEKIYNYDNEKFETNIFDIHCRLNKNYDRKQYQLEIIGGGYLHSYLNSLPIRFLRDNEANGRTCCHKKVYIICDNSTYNWKNYFEKADSSDIFIFLHEFLMDYYYKDPHWYLYHSRMQVNQSIRSIVTGISYIRDALKDNSFLNLANTGQDLEHDFAMFKKYMEICDYSDINVKNIIIGMCPYSLRYSMKHSRVNAKQLLLYESVIEGILLEQGYSYYYWWYKWQKKLIDTFLNDFDIQKCFFEHYVPIYGRIDYKETVVFNELRLSDNERVEYKRIQHETYDKPYEWTIQENKEILRKYVDSASKRGLKIFIFIPPYTELYKKEWNRNYLIETKEYLAELKRIYDIHILDLTGEYFPDWYFHDAGHLNTVGQAVVTKKVLEYMD